VYFCVLHSTILKVVKKKWLEKMTDLTVAALRSKDDETILTYSSFSQKRAIEDVARRSARYRQGIGSLQPRISYRDLMRDAGLIWPNGNVNHRGLNASILAYFGPEYCQLAGMNWQKIAVWSRNIANPTMAFQPSHPFMSIAAESLLDRRCVSPGSFVPAIAHKGWTRETGLSKPDGGTVDLGTEEMSCVGVLHRSNDTWEECPLGKNRRVLVCSCGVSYQVSNSSRCGKGQLTVKGYGTRYQSHIRRMLLNGVSIDAASRELHMTVAAFLRWADTAGVTKKTFSETEVQCLRNRWCHLVQNGRADRRITSAYRVDPKLYRTLCRYDREWFAAFNKVNRSPPYATLRKREGKEPITHELWQASVASMERGPMVQGLKQ
jgi:hypothetical protein